MLYYALLFLVVALIAGFLGFGGIAFAAAGIAKILFFVFLVVFIVTLIMHLAKVVNYGLEAKLEADAELIKNRLFWGFNLLYEPETTRTDLGQWQNESIFGISSALAYQIVPNVVIGADLWYLRHYDGAAFNSFTGDAVYLGPTFYWKIAPKVLMSAAWETQIAGHEPGVTSNLDLTDFSRQRARLLLEFEF